MCNIVLSDDLSIRSYFEKVLNLSKLGDKFPVNLDDVWPLVYSAKEKAVRALVSSDQFMQGIDYEILATNGENTTVGRPVNVYMISISCMEYFIARKVRSVFNVYRDVFHKVINKIPSSYSEALRMYADEVEARERAEKEAKLALEAKRISDNIIKEQAPMVEFAKTAEIAQETDMLIREVREKLEAHGYDIAEKNLRILLEDKKFFAKTGKRWLLSQRMIDSGYARYRYRNDDEFYGTNTVYVTPKGFQWIVSKISKEWMPRFLELKGRVLSRSDKDIFAKR
jgi:phage antirepressor YoqD-like protein|nr:MAG: antirepressor protein KilAC domain [Bacteriophage sp.]UWG19834.1 MAG: antirepressor protein KilAC domain [Bacteriophage sp.]DAZ75176.1 MAG TPA: antirepressor protein [Caudoviricetes sp.]